MIRIFTLSELVRYAKKNSLFYQEQYKDLSLSSSRISIQTLPIVDLAKFWEYGAAIENNKVICQSLSDAIVFKSGGTSGQPKFSFFTKKEWIDFTTVFGQGILKGGLKKGYKIANLFYAGDLYASFLFIKDSIQNAKLPLVHFPISGTIAMENIIEHLNFLKPDVIAATPTTIINIATHLQQNNITLRGIKKILYGGESLYADQQEFLKEVFIGANIHSIGCASVDGGLIGYYDPSCAVDEHRSFSKYSILEIIDEDTGQPIDEEGVVGKLVLTNLIRSFMPIIRFPTGDRAMWVEKSKCKDRKFKLCGRSDISVRIGPMSICVNDIKRILEDFRHKIPFVSFQLVITHEYTKDKLSLQIALHQQYLYDKERYLRYVSQLKEVIYQERKMYIDLINNNIVLPLEINLCSPSELIVNPRSGKIKLVVDKRYNL